MGAGGVLYTFSLNCIFGPVFLYDTPANSKRFEILSPEGKFTSSSFHAKAKLNLQAMLLPYICTGLLISPMMLVFFLLNEHDVGPVVAAS